MKRPVLLGEHIRKIVKDLGLDKKVETARIFTLWQEWVGDIIGSHSKPVKLKYGKLYVKVENDAWRNELVFQKYNIIKKINEKTGRDIVQDILFI